MRYSAVYPGSVGTAFTRACHRLGIDFIRRAAA
jgi:hypothetical protein